MEDVHLPPGGDQPFLPGYETLGVLGRGSTGTVFLAVQSRLGRQVAIKRLGAVGVAQAQMSRRFRREARTLAALDHPNIVRVYDFVEDGRGGMYLVMEFVQGPTLRQLQSGLDTATSLGCIRQLASAIGYASARGVIHRDIKPENVLVTPDGTCKLTDFGIAKVIAESLGGASLAALATQAGDVMGTGAYISPEAASGRLDVGPEADVYSLGVLTYELLVGRLPFEEETFWAAIVAHGSKVPPRPSEIRPGFPLAVEAVLLSALEKEPALRPRPASKFWERLERAAAEAWPGWADQAGMVPPLGPVDLARGVDRSAETGLAPVGNGDPNAARIVVDETAAGEVPIGIAGAARPPPQASPPAFRKRRRRSRRIAGGAATVFVAALVGIGVTLLLRDRSSAGSALAVTSVLVSVAPSTQGTCPRAVFDFRGEIKTNGGAGNLRFSWRRPDGTEGPVQSRPVAAGAQTDVETLQFTFSGSGSAVGEASLHVVSPADVFSAPVPVHYQCP